MAQYKGWIATFLISMAFTIPFFLNMGIMTIQNNAFIKHTTEFSGIVQEEGGRTQRVERVINELNKKGYSISLKNSDGQEIHSNKMDVGETITIDYIYKYKGVYNKESVETTDFITVNRR